MRRSSTERRVPYSITTYTCCRRSLPLYEYITHVSAVITCAKEVIVSSALVCLLVSRITQNYSVDSHRKVIDGKATHGLRKKRLDFDGNAERDTLGYGWINVIIRRIGSYPARPISLGYMTRPPPGRMFPPPPGVCLNVRIFRDRRSWRR